MRNRLVSGWLMTAAIALAAPSLSLRDLPSPAPRGAMAPAFAANGDGKAWLAWIEPAVNGQVADPSTRATVTRVRLATLAAGKDEWSAARTIVTGENLATEPANGPRLALDSAGQLYAMWCTNDGGAGYALSRDDGTNWSRPHAWSGPGDAVRNFSLTTLATGRVLAAWLSQTATHGRRMEARILDVGQPDRVISRAVSEDCATSLVAFLDGGALAAWRGRNDDSARDVQVARFFHARWNEPRTLSPDDWRLAQSPADGPQLSTDGSRVAAAWFTAADGEPRVLVSYSPDAGVRWLMPLRVDAGGAAGHVDTVLLHDGAILVSWLGRDGSVWLRRISPEFSLGDAIPLAPAGAAAETGFPRLWRRTDYRGGAGGDARVLVAYTRAKRGGLALAELQVAEGALLGAERNCNCAPTEEELVGFAIRGRLLALDPTHHSAQASHDAVPGVFEPGTHVFAVRPEEFANLHAGREFLGRVEWRDGAWHLSAIRLLGEPTP